MNAEVDVSRRFAFVLVPESVTRIWTLLKKVGGVSATASCLDDTDRQFSDAKQLLDFENPKAKQILALEFSAYSDDGRQSGYLKFSDEWWNTVTLRLKGPQSTVSRLKDDILDVIDGSKAWYSAISRVDIVFVVSVLLVFGSTVLMAMMPERQQPRLGMSFGKAVAGAAIVFAALGGLGLLAWLLSRMQHWLFPRAAFALSQGQKRYTHRDMVRWVVIVGFIVSVFASLVAAFVFSA